MIWCNLVVWLGKIRLQPVNFCFFTKTMSFWLFLKIEINLGDLVIRWKPGTRILDRAGYWIGFKNYAEMFKDLGKIHFGKKTT